MFLFFYRPIFKWCILNVLLLGYQAIIILFELIEANFEFMIKDIFWFKNCIEFVCWISCLVLISYIAVDWSYISWVQCAIVWLSFMILIQALIWLDYLCFIQWLVEAQLSLGLIQCTLLWSQFAHKAFTKLVHAFQI